MKSIHIVVIAMGAWALLSACSLAQRYMPGTTMSDADVLGVLNSINRSEVDAGQLASERASSEAVRVYASRMVADHQAKIAETSQLVKRIRLEPHQPALAESIDNTHRKAMENLREKAGLNFDKAYIKYEIKMHDQSVDLVKNMADAVNDPQFRRYLLEIRPEMETHLEAALTVQRHF
ncbi:MAG: DUF4142 domain-containing protein [Nitrospira sp. BO4]|jgi:putative membrane protein|nr:DUF4142 domain-containing protein [Nitrospira sp. BO4]